MIVNSWIDHGRGFDWGRASDSYARYRDIYPEAFYQRLLAMGACVRGQRVLDLGTGTGVLPRNLYQYGADFCGIDRSERQIEQARKLAREQEMEIDFRCVPAEEACFPENTFDVVTACQCFPYFHHARLAERIHKIIKRNGRLIVLYMAWLPFEDEIAGKSEELVLNYNPAWTGCGETRHPIEIPSVYDAFFSREREEVFDLSVPFTRESWNGRMRTCRGIEASLSAREVAAFDAEHRELLAKSAPERFEVLHYAAITVLRKRPAIK